MTLSLVPPIAIVLINICLLGYLLRLGDRSRSGFFLLINGLALILWAAGNGLYWAVEVNEALALPHLAVMLVPANFLYHAISRPRPISPRGESLVWLFIIFFPALFLTLAENYDGAIADLLAPRATVRVLPLDSLSVRASVLFATLSLLGAVAIQVSRYNTTTGPERNLAKHLIAVMLAPWIFTGVFWVGMGSTGTGIIPAPAIMMALMAQGGMVAVLRQEEVGNRGALHRIVYTMTAVLGAFVLVVLMGEFYSLAIGSVFMDATAVWLLVVVVLLLLLALRIGGVQETLDSLLFTRAAEYRRVVEDTRRDLREARERVRRAERLSMVGELVARVAHEIKNPLGPIRGYTQIMREKIERDPAFPQRDSFLRHLSVISEEVDSIDSRVRQLLEQSRPPELNLEEVDVERQLMLCASILRLELETAAELNTERPIPEIAVKTEPMLPAVEADRDRLEEVLFNLGRNALEAIAATELGGRVELSVARGDAPDGIPGVMIAIEDSGPGLSDADMERLFEPFFTKGKVGGTGLGLAIVRSAIKAHGGRIWADRSALGGLRFVVWLPLVAKPDPSALLPQA